MAQAMIKLGQNFELRRQMGNIGYERVKRSYTYEQFIEAYRRIYNAEKEALG